MSDPEPTPTDASPIPPGWITLTRVTRDTEVPPTIEYVPANGIVRVATVRKPSNDDARAVAWLCHQEMGVPDRASSIMCAEAPLEILRRIDDAKARQRERWIEEDLDMQRHRDALQRETDANP